MEISKNLDQALNKYVRTSTHAVAIKVQKDTELSAEAKRPMTFFGHPLTICQGISIVRRYGWVLGFQKEDHACGVSLIILGMIEEPEFIKDGSLVYPLYTETLEKGEITQKVVPHMTYNEIGSLLLAPLYKANFEPDLVLIYGNPGQVVRLIQGALYDEGGAIESKFMGRAACGSEIVTPLLSQKCNVIIPGGGEKVFAQTADDELVFAVPRIKMSGLAYGLAATHKAGAARFPVPQYGLRIEPKFPEEYSRLERYCGIVK